MKIHFTIKQSKGGTMKILVFTDLHGSLNALKALIQTQDFKTADQVIFLGDAVMGCSRPNECIDLLRELNIICVLGNNDSYLCCGIDPDDKPKFTRTKLNQMEWMDAHVTKENKEFVASWPYSYVIKDESLTFYFTHYPWTKNKLNVVDEPFIKCLYAREKLFRNIKADYYFFGHEHKTSIYSNRKQSFICVGTVGVKNPGSYFVILTEPDIQIKEKFVEFDINEEKKLMEAAGYPYNKKKID